MDEVIAANPKQVEQYRAGKTAVIGYLVGQVMKASRGQANPQQVNDLLKEKLGTIAAPGSRGLRWKSEPARTPDTTL